MAIEDLNMLWTEDNNYRLLEHKRLKILTLTVGKFVIHTILRNLSNNGGIEELSIVDGLFDIHNYTETYTFNKLKLLQWRDEAKFEHFFDFIQTFSRANTPVLEKLYFSYYPANKQTKACFL